MVFPQVIAVFHSLYNVIGLPGNLVTIVLDERLHVMRYILLASLAASDFLCLILVNSFRIASIAQEKWLYGQTICDLNAFFGRYFYHNTILHLIAISYERYSAIVKSPLTYDGTITKSRVVFMVLIWIAPIPHCIGPFLGHFGKYVYNPELFICEQGWSVQDARMAANKIVVPIIFLALPILVIGFLNWRVFKTVKILQTNRVQVGSLGESEDQQQEMTRTRGEHKAAVDVAIIIGAFLLCLLPGWVADLCRQFARNTKVSAEVVLSTKCSFFISTLCNPIIYSIRKKEFRASAMRVLRRMGICRNSMYIDERAIHVYNPRAPSRFGEESNSRAMQQNLSHIEAEDIRETSGL